MNDKHRAEIVARWAAIDRELAELSSGRVVADDPANRERELLDEQDALEFELGSLQFDER